jgi:hypothetical protein
MTIESFNNRTENLFTITADGNYIDINEYNKKEENIEKIVFNSKNTYYEQVLLQTVVE